MGGIVLAAGVIAGAAVFPSSPAGEDPAGDGIRLEVAPRGGPVAAHACRDLADALLNLDLSNRGARAVSVEGVSVALLSGERVLRAEDLGSSLFDAGAVERKRKIPEGGTAEWSRICLDRIPRDADRIRLDFSLSSRAGMARHRSTKRVELPLRPSPPPVILRLPFEGYWQVTQGHSCRANHRLGGFGSDYAWDFVHCSPTGRTVSDNYGETLRNEDSYSYGLAVLAPVEGTVVRVVSDVPDNEGLKEYPRASLFEDLGRPSWIFGNFVVIDAGGGAHVMLAHLQKDSVVVKQGDRVRAGDPIAKCGNSGNSILPHLHVQAMDRPDPSETSVRGLPARFANYREITYAGGAAHKDILARALAEGDPPEGSIVAALSAEEARP